MKNWNFWEKSLINRQKAHPEGKCFLKSDNINWGWPLGNRKKIVRQKGKGPAKSFSYGPRSPKPRDQKLEKFLPHLISRGDCKTSGEKRRWKRFRALRSKRSGWGLRLNLGGLKRLWFILQIDFDELCTKQTLKPTNENHGTFENGGFPLPKF